METYGRILGRLYDRLTGQAPESTTTPVTVDMVRAILDDADDVDVTHFRASVAPATTHHLTGDDPLDGWDSIAEKYDLRDPELTTYDGGDLAYEISVEYYRDDLYKGQWRFRDEDDDPLWTALNDV